MNLTIQEKKLVKLINKKNFLYDELVKSCNKILHTIPDVYTEYFSISAKYDCSYYKLFDEGFDEGPTLPHYCGIRGHVIEFFISNGIQNADIGYEEILILAKLHKKYFEILEIVKSLFEKEENQFVFEIHAKILKIEKYINKNKTILEDIIRKVDDFKFMIQREK